MTCPEITQKIVMLKRKFNLSCQLQHLLRSLISFSRLHLYPWLTTLVTLYPCPSIFSAPFFHLLPCLIAHLLSKQNRTKFYNSQPHLLIFSPSSSHWPLLIGVPHISYLILLQFKQAVRLLLNDVQGGFNIEYSGDDLLLQIYGVPNNFFLYLFICTLTQYSQHKITQHKHYTNTMLHFTVDPSNLTPKKVKTQMGKKEIDEGRVAMNIVEVDGVHR